MKQQHPACERKAIQMAENSSRETTKSKGVAWRLFKHWEETITSEPSLQQEQPSGMDTPAGHTHWKTKSRHRQTHPKNEYGKVWEKQ